MIALAVRWYVRYRLNYADVVEELAERELMTDRSTVLPLGPANPAALPGGRPCPQVADRGKWRVDETYCRLNGRWTYLYRVIDQDGQVVDVYFSQRRNSAASDSFVRRAIGETGVQTERVTTDKARCHSPAL